MCLRKFSELKTAEQDIEVVKYLVLRGDTALSPFKDHSYEFGVLKEEKDSWSWTVREAEDPGQRDWGGLKYGFHTHAAVLKPDEPNPSYWEERSREHDQWWQLTKVDGAVPFRAIIPKGSQYFEGVDDWGVKGFISEKILVKEQRL